MNTETKHSILKKTTLCMLTVFIFSIILTACGKEKTEMDSWAEAAELDKDETADELYEAAKKEDVLKIYTVSSRLFDVAESFQKQYPDLLVEVTYYRAEEITTRLAANKSSGNYDCDLIFITNGDGSITENLIPNQLAYKYVPKDIQKSLRTGGSDKYLSILLEVPLLTYNSNVYDKPPISNWWELTEEKWRGKLYITNPSKSMISYTMFAMFIQHSEEMEKAYKDYFAKDFVPENGENAGEAFIRMLIENDINVVNDSDDAANAIASPVTPNDAVGILNASKLRMKEQGYPLEVCYNPAPFAGVINPANIMIAGGSENINSAKLFIRWILGETDGKGEGYKPFLQEGAWPGRTDVDGGASMKLEDMNVIYTDEEFASRERAAFLEFWNKTYGEHRSP